MLNLAISNSKMSVNIIGKNFFFQNFIVSSWGGGLYSNIYGILNLKVIFQEELQKDTKYTYL